MNNLSNERKTMIINTWDDCLKNLTEDLQEYKGYLLDSAKDKRAANSPHLDRNMIKEIFLHRLKAFHDHYSSLGNIERDIKDILG